MLRVFNTSGTELLVILLVALIVLGPEKLPEAARKVGNVMKELRRMSSGFQAEVRDALAEPIGIMNETMNTVKSGLSDSAPATASKLPSSDLPPPSGRRTDLPPPPA